jgi:hypothetical protein
MRNFPKVATLSSFILLLIPMACHHHDKLEHHVTLDEPDVGNYAQEPLAYENALANAIDRAVAMPLDGEILEQPMALEVPNPAVSLSPYGPVGSVTDPYLYARSVFDSDLAVPPWRANYVGSYGVMPGRYQNEGPLLYSLDVRPDADVFYNGYGPMVFDEDWWPGFGDDDDDY